MAHKKGAGSSRNGRDSVGQRLGMKTGAGQAVNAGDVLVELDTRQERAQLANVEAERDLAKVNFARLSELVKQGVLARQEYDTATAQQKATEAQVGEIRATIARKTIRAPFSGILGIRQVNLGQYLAAGQAIVPLQSLNPIYVNFGVPQETAGKVRIGGSLRVTSTDVSGARFSGRVNAMPARAAIRRPGRRSMFRPNAFPSSNHRRSCATRLTRMEL